jgi:hypothetical protein
VLLVPLESQVRPGLRGRPDLLVPQGLRVRKVQQVNKACRDRPALQVLLDPLDHKVQQVFKVRPVNKEFKDHPA